MPRSLDKFNVYNGCTIDIESGSENHKSTIDKHNEEDFTKLIQKNRQLTNFIDKFKEKIEILEAENKSLTNQNNILKDQIKQVRKKFES